ncbi:hypothetical protein SFC15_05865 [Shouchella clausii]
MTGAFWIALIVGGIVGGYLYIDRRLHVFPSVFYGLLGFLMSFSLIMMVVTIFNFGGSSLDNDVEKIVNKYLDEAIKIEEGKSDFVIDDSFREEIDEVYYDTDVPAADKKYLGNVEKMMGELLLGNYGEYLNQRDILEGRLEY